MKKRCLSLLLVLAMLVGLVAGLGMTASASAPSDVVEMTVGQNKIYIYAPANDMVLASSCTAPCFMVFGAAPYTAESAKAEAKESGLEALAAAEGAAIVFINPQGENWTEADAAVYGMLIDLYSNASTANFVNGVADVFNFFTGSSDKKILGDTGRVYIYGIGPGADFVAANFMKKVTASVTYPDGFTMSFDRTPTSVTLIAPTTLPAASEPADIAVAVVEGPADAAEKLASLTDKVMISNEEIDVVYDKLSGVYRRQVGVLLPMHDWKAEGITETVKTYSYADGRTVGYAVYHAADLAVNDASAPVPLVLTFHGGDNTALYQAQASEWPLIGKANGFITAAVDNHVAYSAAEIVELIEQLKKDYSIDSTRIYASGFSMGSVKSWALFEEFPTVFAGLAPMSGSFQSPAGEPADVMMPVFYVGGEASPLAELCHQGEDIINRVGYTLKANKVNSKYQYNKDVNLFWGVNGHMIYQVTDKVAFKNSTLTVNLFRSSDGRYYTALANASNMSHEVYARNSWAAWDFLSQFSRNADGTISIEANTYALPSDDGKVVDNSYNTCELPKMTTYTVVKGDSLWAIARSLLGSGFKWSAIYEANKDIISNPNLIYVGQTLAIPAP